MSGQDLPAVVRVAAGLVVVLVQALPLVVRAVVGYVCIAGPVAVVFVLLGIVLHALRG